GGEVCRTAYSSPIQRLDPKTVARGHNGAVGSSRHECEHAVEPDEVVGTTGLQDGSDRLAIRSGGEFVSCLPPALPVVIGFRVSGQAPTAGRAQRLGAADRIDDG